MFLFFALRLKRILLNPFALEEFMAYSGQYLSFKISSADSSLYLAIILPLLFQGYIPHCQLRNRNTNTEIPYESSIIFFFFRIFKQFYEKLTNPSIEGSLFNLFWKEI